jgi:hypothetical protein
MKTTGLVLAFVLLTGGIALAGDYYVYTDAAGRTWLSNQDPSTKDESATRRPDEVTIVKQYRWQDVTDEQIAASATMEREQARVNAIRDVATETQRLTDELRAARLEWLEQAAVANQPIIAVTTTASRPFFDRPHVVRHGPRFFHRPHVVSRGRR